MKEEAVLCLKDVHYHVSSDDEELSIIKGCDLSVQPGEKLSIVGRSGSGKSTLLSLMAGLELPTGGEVRLFGQALNHLDEDRRAQLRALQVGFVFQNFQLMPSMTALENVLMPLELFQVSDADDKALQALDKVGLGHRLSHRPSELSGGEQQRVALARAFVTEPKILFADEPTGNLDETTAEQVQHLLFQLNDELHTTLVLVTHDSDFARQCDRALTLHNGRLQAV
ncbi:ABC transporter ATP-binding protein [Hydrogenovibrio thermophilus]|uniref:ABC transporter ATP-binding protein n=1 Tax=Hydrogenovibrio thermophilus TaxID=265883 RepID=A0A410H1I4_9GAMM|nr:ABC transporter ATP-binding protein [Hydrogenovibrio thermophilus]QAB14779.1 ABC transporter ATP-binding protein [Hydrogenovibrio thermophilus]